MIEPGVTALQWLPSPSAPSFMFIGTPPLRNSPLLSSINHPSRLTGAVGLAGLPTTNNSIQEIELALFTNSSFTIRPGIHDPEFEFPSTQ